jgi:hypothetical protein
LLSLFLPTVSFAGLCCDSITDPAACPGPTCQMGLGPMTCTLTCVGISNPGQLCNAATPPLCALRQPKAVVFDELVGFACEREAHLAEVNLGVNRAKYLLTCLRKKANGSGRVCQRTVDSRCEVVGPDFDSATLARVTRAESKYLGRLRAECPRNSERANQAMASANACFVAQTMDALMEPSFLCDSAALRCTARVVKALSRFTRAEQDCLADCYARKIRNPLVKCDPNAGMLDGQLTACLDAARAVGRDRIAARCGPCAPDCVGFPACGVYTLASMPDDLFDFVDAFVFPFYDEREPSCDAGACDVGGTDTCLNGPLAGAPCQSHPECGRCVAPITVVGDACFDSDGCERLHPYGQTLSAMRARGRLPSRKTVRRHGRSRRALHARPLRRPTAAAAIAR